MIKRMDLGAFFAAQSAAKNRAIRLNLFCLRQKRIALLSLARFRARPPWECRVAVSAGIPGRTSLNIPENEREDPKITGI
jgi:hypothetical protein